MNKLMKLILKLLLLCIIVASLLISIFVIQGYFMYQDALKEMPIEDKIEEIKSKENYVELEDIPKIYRNAVIAVEDHRFYEHGGIDILAIFGAIINDISSKKLVQGGSTITQQLCKNIYFTQDRTLERKFAETFMSAKLEDECEKDMILELYINTCFYGNGCYTLKEASNYYLDKEPKELSDFEAILLSGVPNAPSLYNPKYSLKLAKERQSQVLYAMIKYGYITQKEKEDILSQEKDVKWNF